VFVEESEVELSRRSRRSEEIELKRCEVALGIVGAQCLTVQQKRKSELTGRILLETEIPVGVKIVFA